MDFGALNIDAIAAHILRARTLVTLDSGKIADFGTDWIMEAEGVTHLVVPLLRALGWSDKQIAVEWYHPNSDTQRRIDVCLFTKMPRKPENCHYLIEAKRRWHDPKESLKVAHDQAKGYAEKFDPKRNFVITNGVIYQLDTSKNLLQRIQVCDSMTSLLFRWREP